MAYKQLLAAATMIAFAVPAFAQTGERRVTAEQCIEINGIVDQVAGTCTVSDDDDIPAAFVSSGGIGAAGAVAAAGVLIVLLLDDGDDDTTTTTTGS